LHKDDVVKDANVVPTNSKETFPKPYAPPLPFPQRMAKAKLNLQFRKFLEVLKKLYINIPFADALSQCPLMQNFCKKFYLIKES